LSLILVNFVTFAVGALAIFQDSSTDNVTNNMCPGTLHSKNFSPLPFFRLVSWPTAHPGHLISMILRTLMARKGSECYTLAFPSCHLNGERYKTRRGPKSAACVTLSLSSRHNAEGRVFLRSVSTASCSYEVGKEADEVTKMRGIVHDRGLRKGWWKI
jgi:hypothetical protein